MQEKVFLIMSALCRFFLLFLKVAFFQKVRCVFQISKSPKKIFQITILDLKSKFSANFSILLLAGNLNFKFRIAFWNIFFGRFGDLKTTSHFLKKVRVAGPLNFYLLESTTIRNFVFWDVLRKTNLLQTWSYPSVNCQQAHGNTWGKELKNKATLKVSNTFRHFWHIFAFTLLLVKVHIFWEDHKNFEELSQLTKYLTSKQIEYF